MTVAFDDKSAPPDNAALAKALGKANTAWRALAEHLAAGAKAYAEGTPARVEVAGKRELAVVQRLLALK